MEIIEKEILYETLIKNQNFSESQYLAYWSLH